MATSVSPPPGSAPLAGQAHSTNTDAMYVSYQDDFGVWKYVEGELRQHLPLRHVALRPTRHVNGQILTLTHPRVIDSMDVKLLSFDDERLQLSSAVANLYKKPYLYLYIVHCDDSELYKQVVKPKIKSWVQTMTERQQEWLIVYASLGHRRTLVDLASKLQRSVYDRIRMDFNVPATSSGPLGLGAVPAVGGRAVTRDRCCQLRLLDPQPDHDHWEDLTNKMKEGIAATIDQHILTYEEELKKADARRAISSPAWSYPSYFFLKESLAFVLERAHMMEDALIHYLELEAMYKEVGVRFERFGGSDALDDSSSPLDYTKKPYRELLYQGSISEFDFRQYLFARESRLLMMMGRPAEAAHKAVSFIGSMSLALHRHRDVLAPFFRESWIFSACMVVAEQCERARQSASPQITIPSISVSASSSFTPLSSSSSSSSFIAPLVHSHSTPSIPAQVQVQPKAKSSTPPIHRIIRNSVTTPLSGATSLLNPSATVTQAQASSSTVTLAPTPPPLPQPSPAFSSSSSLSQSTNAMLMSNQAIKSDKEIVDNLLADLLYHARTKLDKLGLAFGLLVSEPLDPTGSPNPSRRPAATTPTATSSSPAIKRISSHRLTIANSLAGVRAHPDQMLFITNSVLRLALQSEADFDKLYLHLTSRATQLYTDSGRARSVVRLNQEIADIYFLRGVFDKAEYLLTSVSNTYWTDGWPELEYRARLKLAECQRRLNRTDEYVSTCLMLLNPELPASPADRVAFMTLLTDALQAPLSAPLQRDMEPIMQVALKLAPTEQRARVGQVVPLSCCITSTLPGPAPNARITVSMAAFAPAEDTLTFEADGEVTLVPGENHLTLHAKPSSVNSYSWSRLTISLGQVVLSHSLTADYTRSVLRVLEGQSSVQLEPVIPPTLIYGAVQTVAIRVCAHEDAVEAASLRLWSPTGLTLLDVAHCTLVRRTKDGAESGVQATLLRGRVTFGGLAAGDTITVYVPVNGSAGPTDTYASHQLLGELYHEKKGEKFVVSTAMNLSFVCPLVSRPIVITLPRAESDEGVAGIFLQVLYTSVAKCNLEIVGFGLSGLEKAGLTLKTDPNENARGSKVLPNQQLSLVFPLVPSSSAVSDGTLDVSLQYRMPWPSPGSGPAHLTATSFVSAQHEYSCSVSVASPPRAYAIDIHYPETCVVGTPVPVRVLITRQGLHGGGPPAAVQYELDIDLSVWMLSGSKKHTFPLAPGDTHEVECQLIAIAPGFLPAPRPRLLGGARATATEPPTSRQIHAYPRPFITSSCLMVKPTTMAVK